jgi:hypothetical protein
MQDNNEKCSYYKSFIDYIFTIQLNTLHQLQQIHMENNVTIFNPNAQLMRHGIKEVKLEVKLGFNTRVFEYKKRIIIRILISNTRVFRIFCPTQ